MYMAYGWPQVIPIELPRSSSPQQRIVYIKVINRLLLVVSPSHLELWSSFQHKVRLSKYKRDPDSVQREGENKQAVWSPDTKLIAVLTSSFYLHIFKVQFTNKRINIGGKQPSTLLLANINLVLDEQIPFSIKNVTVSNIVCDNKHLLIGLSDGSLYTISWKGEFYGAFDIISQVNGSDEIIRIPYSFENGTASGINRDRHVSVRGA